MYKIFILFLGFFLLASCNTTTQNPVSETKTETTKTETQKQEITTEITPFAGIEVENEDEIKWVQFWISNMIIKQKETKSLYEAFGYNQEEIANIKKWDEENKTFLRSHKEKILENFPEFKNNPTTEKNPENFTITTDISYKLINDLYHPNSDTKINTEKTQLLAGFRQNYNHTYTGSLWDLPLASLSYNWLIEAGQKADNITIATIGPDTPTGFLNITTTSNGENDFLQTGTNTTDNTYTQIPDKISHNLESLKNIFEILNSKPNPENIFAITNILPNTHKISDIIYENGNEKISLKNLISISAYPQENSNFSEYSINLAENKDIIKNATGKITFIISEK